MNGKRIKNILVTEDLVSRSAFSFAVYSVLVVILRVSLVQAARMPNIVWFFFSNNNFSIILFVLLILSSLIHLNLVKK